MACGRYGQGAGEVKTRLVGDTILQTQGSMRHLLADGYVRISGYDVCNLCPEAPESMGAKWMTGERSEHAKALATLADGQLQHPVHLFIGVICREAQLVKTCVCSRQRAMGWSGNNLK